MYLVCVRSVPVSTMVIVTWVNILTININICKQLNLQTLKFLMLARFFKAKISNTKKTGNF